ncbi:MAG: SurA N-terminal domain-containing protein [Holosporales bacterium]|jgi:peptidyl-prolyl cis-trans isomerase D
MIQLLRDRATGIFAKTLLGLLLFAFVITGGESLFNQRRIADDKIATVGEGSVSSAAVTSAYKSQIERYQQLINAGIPEDVLRRNIMENIVQQQVEQALVDAYAADIGLKVSDDLVAKELASMPEFQTNGTFDRMKYQEILANSRLSEAELARLIKSSLPRQYIDDAFKDLWPMPRVAGDLLDAYSREERQVAVVRLPLASIDPASLDTTFIEGFYAQNSRQFAEPERRDVSYVVLKPVNNPAAISDDDVKKAYEERKDSLGTPETRSVEQWLFPDMAAAKGAVAALKAGGNWADLSAGMYKSNWTNLSLRQAGDLPEALSNPVFALPKGGITEALQTGLGIHLLHVTAITPATIPTFADAKADLKQRLIEEAGYAALVQQSEVLEEALAKGKPLAEAASSAGVKTFTWSNLSRSADLSRDPILAANPGIVPGIFTAGLNEPSTALELAGNGGYLYYTVTKSTASTTPPLASIETLVRGKAAVAKARQDALARADGLATKIKEGAALAEVAKAAGLKSPELLSLRRNGSSEALPAGLTRQLLAIQKGTCASDDDPKGGAVLACVTGVRFDAQATKDNDNQQADLRGDLDAAFMAALRERYPVQYNEQALQRLYGSSE